MQTEWTGLHRLFGPAAVILPVGIPEGFELPVRRGLAVRAELFEGGLSDLTELDVVRHCLPKTPPFP